MVSFNSIDMPIQVDGSTTIPVKQLYMYIKRSSKLRIRILLGTIFTGISTINQQKYGSLHHPCKLRILHGALLDGIVLTIWTLYIAIFRKFPLHNPCNLSLSTHNSTSHLGEGKRRCSGRRGSVVEGDVFYLWDEMHVPNLFFRYVLLLGKKLKK